MNYWFKKETGAGSIIGLHTTRCINMIMSHTLRHILAILMATSVFIPLVALYCRNKPFSKVFGIFNKKDDVFITAKGLNNERLMKAKEYIQSLPKSKLTKYSKRPELAIVIVTIKRKAYDLSSLGYVLQTVAVTHKLYVQDKMFPNKTMMICNVDLNPLNYTEVVSLKPYVPVVERYGSPPPSTDLTRQQLYAKKTYDSKYDKETVDYMYCLESAYSIGAKYVLLMEDDALPMTNTLEVMYDKIQYLHRKHKEFVYIKLYYPQKWQGYGYEMNRILELISIGFVGAGVVIALHFLFCKSRLYYIRVAYFLCGIWLGILSALIIGRQNVYEFYRLSQYLYTLKPSPGCCTQAMMYTRQFIPTLLQFLAAKHKHLHTDLAIYNFTNITGLPAYQIEPNLFYHVGMYTSLTSDKHKNAEEFMFIV